MRRSTRALTASAVALAGLLTIASAVTPNVPWRQHALVAVERGSLIAFGHVLAAAAGVALVWLALKLARGNRRAANATIALLVASAFLHVAKGLDYEEAGVALALALLLYLGRPGSSHHGERARAVLRAGVVAIAAVAAAYLLWMLRLLAGADGTLMLLLFGALFLAVRALLRPSPSVDGHTAGDHALAAQIVAEHGSDSLAPFVLREDKAFFFSHGGLLAYRTLHGTAVVSSDPVGPPGAAPSILREFLGYAETRGWDVVLTAASERYVRDYQAQLGLRALPIGNEAVVDPSSFTLEGRAIRKVRQSVRRIEKRGWRIETVRSADLGAATVAEIRAVQAAWSEAQSGLKGFAMSLGRLWGAAEDTDCLYVLARDPDGRVAAFLHFLPYGDGISLDAMRRIGDEPNGLNEALVVRALEYAREKGMREVSLNFAGFAHVMAADAALSFRRRVLRLLLRRFHSRFQLDRLVRFNEKFFPAWRPRFLVYGTRTQLPLAALRVLQAEAYIRPPRPRPLATGWRPLPDPVPTLATVAR